MFAKVRLANVIRPNAGLAPGPRQSALNRIVGKHVDFLLCRSDDLSIVCAIELDDSSHAKAMQKTRDQFVEAALQAAVVPLLRFPAKAGYRLEDVKSQLAQVTGPRSAPQPGLAAQPLPQIGSGPDRSCPKCSAAMLLRTAAKGKNSGHQFWGCSNYPRCKTILPVEAREEGLAEGAA